MIDIKHIIPLILIYILIQIIIGAILMRRYEKKQWNNGVCSKCGDKWRLIDIDSHGGRMYKCDNWHYCDVSYNVDKIH